LILSEGDPWIQVGMQDFSNRWSMCRLSITHFAELAAFRHHPIRPAQEA
jgi:hypothetical protein